MEILKDSISFNKKNPLHTRIVQSYLFSKHSKNKSTVCGNNAHLLNITNIKALHGRLTTSTITPQFCFLRKT